MNNNEADKVIAEFMGKKYYTCLEWNTLYGTKDEPVGFNGMSFVIQGYYANSLDSLVSVWERLDFPHLTLDTKMTTWVYLNHDIKGEGKTFQEAAAHATAKAIL